MEFYGAWLTLLPVLRSISIYNKCSSTARDELLVCLVIQFTRFGHLRIVYVFD